MQNQISFLRSIFSQPNVRPVAAGGLLLIVLAGFALSAALDGRLPRLLFGGAVQSAPWQAWLCWLVTALAALGAFARFRALVIRALMFVLLAAFFATSLAAAQGAFDLASLVAPAECLVIGLATGALGERPGQPSIYSRALTGCTAAALLLFGVIHLVHAGDIAAIVPAWLPARAYVPYATGTILFLGGAGLILTRARGAAARLVAIMFVAWLPIVHVPRIAARPLDPFEWQFALMALALAASLFVIAALAPTTENHAIEPTPLALDRF